MCSRLCTCVCYTTVSTPQAVYSCMVYNGVRNESFIFATARESFFAFSLHRPPVRLYGHSLKVYVRQKTNVSSPKCIDIASSVHTGTLHTYRDKCSFDSCELRLSPFRAGTPRASSSSGADRCARGRIPLPLLRQQLKCFRVQGTK